MRHFGDTWIAHDFPKLLDLLGPFWTIWGDYPQLPCLSPLFRRKIPKNSEFIIFCALVSYFLRKSFRETSQAYRGPKNDSIPCFFSSSASAILSFPVEVVAFLAPILVTFSCFAIRCCSCSRCFVFGGRDRLLVDVPMVSSGLPCCSGDVVTPDSPVSVTADDIGTSMVWWEGSCSPPGYGYACD